MGRPTWPLPPVPLRSLSARRLGAAKLAKRSGTRCAGDGLQRSLRPGRLPELSGNLDRVDPSRFPPQRLIARAVELAVVQAAQRNGEFVAYLAPEGELLGEAHVVRLGGLAPAE